MHVEDNQMYRVKAVAEMFDVSPATIYRAISSGDLDAYKIGTGRGALRIPGHAIQIYANECGEAAYQAYVRLGDNPASDDDTTTETGYAPEPGRLTGAQARGLACVVCKADFVHEVVERAPVGTSPTGQTVYACAAHTPDAVREAEAFRRTDPDAHPDQASGRDESTGEA